eukprot:3962842-Amphidinium_carterae.4
MTICDRNWGPVRRAYGKAIVDQGYYKVHAASGGAGHPAIGWSEHMPCSESGSAQDGISRRCGAKSTTRSIPTGRLGSLSF